MSKKPPRTRLPGELPPLDDAPEPAEPKPRNKDGRPKKSREVANRQTVYLDQARYDQLVRIQKNRGRSIHSIILEGIDRMIVKERKRWGDDGLST